MAEKQYYYGVIFWNEKTDVEIFTYFQAESYYHAEKFVEQNNYNGFWNMGMVHFIGDDHKNYDTLFVEFVKKEQ